MMNERQILGKYIEEYSVRNKSGEALPVYSVTNDKGFCQGYFDKDVSSKDKSGYKIVPRGYFAYNPSRINVGSIACQEAEDRVIVSPLYVVFGVSGELYNPYLMYFLKSPYANDYINAYARGAVRNNFGIKKMCELTLPVPSLASQQGIVEELDAIHAIITAKNEQLRELDKLAEAIFYDMFGDPITNEKGWEIKNLGDICLVKGRIGFRGYTRNDFVETAEEGAISLSPTNIINGHMDFSKCSYVTWDKYNESPEIIVREGDILLVKTGSSYGKCAYVDSLPHESTINPQFVVIKELKIDGRYLTAYLQSEAAKIKYEGFVLGTAIPTFSQKSLNSMPVLCPPLDLQQAFASKISAIEQQKELIRASITETETLLAARMQHYFD